MGLARIDALKREEKSALEIDLFEVTGEHDIIRFREPRAADLFPNPELKQEIKIAFPEFPALMLDQVCLLGKTYIKDETDTEVSPIRSFGRQVIFLLLMLFYRWPMSYLAWGLR